MVNNQTTEHAMENRDRILVMAAVAMDDSATTTELADILDMNVGYVEMQAGVLYEDGLVEILATEDAGRYVLAATGAGRKRACEVLGLV